MLARRANELVTIVVVVAELFPGAGSNVSADTAAKPTTVVLLGVLELTLTVNIIATEPLMNDGVVQVIAPVPPTAGIVQVKPNLEV